MKTKILTMFVLLAMTLGCRSNQPLTDVGTGSIPSWYMNLPQAESYIHAANTSTSRDLQTAFDKATLDARAEIANQIEINIQGIQKSFTEEVGIDEDAQFLQMFSQATRSIVNASLVGTTVKERHQIRDGNLWRTYVLVEYPIGEAHSNLLRQIKQNEGVYTRLRASETFKELDMQIQRYESEQQRQQGNENQ